MVVLSWPVQGRGALTRLSWPGEPIIAPWDLLPRPGCGLVLPARSSTALDFTLMRTHGALRLSPARASLLIISESHPADSP